MIVKELIVHCLECDNTYPEQQPIVEACPDCGNDNMGLTVYLQVDDTIDGEVQLNVGGI